MRIGGTGSDGLMHLVWELIDNAVDEASAGFADKVDITLHRDRSIEVADNGRGHPDRPARPQEGLCARGRVHRASRRRQVRWWRPLSSGGLHGVGASVVNALAQKLVAEVDRDGATHVLGFNERAAGQFANGSTGTGRFSKGHALVKAKRISKNKSGTRCGSGPTSKSSIPTPSLTSKRSVGVPPRPLPGARHEGHRHRQAQCVRGGREHPAQRAVLVREPRWAR